MKKIIDSDKIILPFSDLANLKIETGQNKTVKIYHLSYILKFVRNLSLNSICVNITVFNSFINFKLKSRCIIMLMKKLFKEYCFIKLI